MTSRIDELRAAGEALDTAVLGARRYIARAAGRGPDRCVLVVEDHAETRELYEASLAGMGFQVHTAANGPEAIAKATALSPDIIVMDFAMPGMDGGEVAHRLEGDERTRGIPVLLLSAYPDVIPREVRLGCAAFLAKPCTPEDLGELLHLIVAARETTGTAPPRRQ